VTQGAVHKRHPHKITKIWPPCRTSSTTSPLVREDSINFKNSNFLLPKVRNSSSEEPLFSEKRPHWSNPAGLRISYGQALIIVFDIHRCSTLKGTMIDWYFIVKYAGIFSEHDAKNSPETSLPLLRNRKNRIHSWRQWPCLLKVKIHIISYGLSHYRSCTDFVVDMKLTDFSDICLVLWLTTKLNWFWFEVKMVIDVITGGGVDQLVERQVSNQTRIAFVLEWYDRHRA